MEWSQHNIIFKELNEYYLFNSLSNFFIKFDKETHNKLIKIKENPNDISLHDNTEIDLLKSKILVSNNKNEIIKLKSLRYLNRYNDNHLSLTIAPTRACNFNCIYCYENDRPDIKMNDKTEENIINFIKDSNKKNIFISWYGGEPLLEFDRIISISKKIKEIDDINYNAGIVTNGYLFDEDIVNELENLNISRIQITLDGSKDFHDVRRPPLKESKSSFDRIIKSIKILLDKTNMIIISIRVNIDNENKNEYYKIYKYLYAEFYEKKERLHIYPAFVEDGNFNCNTNKCIRNSEERSSFLIDQYKNHNIYLPEFFPMTNNSSCMARNANSYMIGPEGELYKCWHILGDQTKIIGNVNEKGNINSDNLATFLKTADNLDNEACINCYLFPVCDGGCPYFRILNETEGGNYNVCKVEKSKLKEFLLMHFDYKLKNPSKCDSKCNS